MRLKGRVGLITGGARGQGQAIALRLAADGADLVVCDVGGVESLEETVAGVVGAGSRCLARVADVCDQAALGEVVGEAICEFGGVDILVANAGVTGPLVPFWEVGEDDWRRTLEVEFVRGVAGCEGGGAAHDRADVWLHRLQLVGGRRRGRLEYLAVCVE